MSAKQSFLERLDEARSATPTTTKLFPNNLVTTWESTNQKERWDVSKNLPINS